MTNKGKVQEGTPGGDAKFGETGYITATLPDPIDENGEKSVVSIHSHPTIYYWGVSGRTLLKQAWDATVPSSLDLEFFPKYEVNIIVGKKGDGNNLNVKEKSNCSGDCLESVADDRPEGMAIFGNNGTSHLWLNKEAVRNILGE